MWTKLAVVSAVFFAANASVIINVFDDPEIRHPLAELLKIKPLLDCNPQWCDQQCRNMGFTGGVCVHDRCKCDINRKEVPETETSLSELITSVDLLDCNPQWCDQQCRNMGFTGGVCVNDRCKCDINKREVPEIALPLSELTKSVYLLNCNPYDCDQQCRNMGFTGGVCVHDRCKCDINRKVVPEIDPSLSELAKSVYLVDCNPQWCDQQCRNMGFTGGVCVHDRCKCDINKKVPVTEAVKYIEEKKRKEDKPSFNMPRACDIFNCNDMCQRLNYVGGTCDMDGQCQCF
ncbi:unnamed protein product [Chrysodeixis includens]|uniref:Knottins-like domain-containing protein n=1 Tax=Chrysodeixis includens TaxID=689277 RepID=A0A9P0C448_CHRIL|nr:unnamed protein product [Chrysodeixis includens]